MSRPTPLARPRAVFFDVTNTLLHVEPGVGEVYARCGERHGRAFDPAALARAFVVRLKAEQKARRAADPGALVYGRTEAQARAFWRVVVAGAVADLGADDAAWAAGPGFDAYFDDVFEAFAQAAQWRLEPDAAPTFAALRARGVRVGLVSNWDARLAALLRALGLDGAVDAVVASYEVGVEKPAPAIFAAAAARLGVAPAEAWHVGDHLEEDVAGARAAGLAAVWFDPGRRRLRLSDAPAHGATPEGAAAVVGALADVVALVDAAAPAGEAAAR